MPPNLDASFWGKPHRPYIATVVQTTETIDAHGARQVHTSRAKYYRDDAGRERSEGFYDSGQLSAVMLRDPSTPRVVMLHVVQKTADVLSEPHPAPAPPGEGWAAESLPSKTILGFHAEGRRFTRKIAPQSGAVTGVVTLTEDAWFSEDLGVVLDEIYNDPRTGRTEKQVTEIEQTDPDPGLFVVPPGYTVHDFRATTP